MAGDELFAFRERWKHELEKKTKTPRTDSGGFARPRSLQSSKDDEATGSKERNEAQNCPPASKTATDFDGRHSAREEGDAPACRSEDAEPQYVSMESLLDGRTSPLLDRIQEEKVRRKRQYDALNSHGHKLQPQKKPNKKDKLVDQFIQDLNDVNDIPFFDVELPYELALKIFQFLGQTDLGRCAQVSKSWRVLAEDEVLWYRLCLKSGYHSGANISDSPCWKSSLRDSLNAENAERTNWKSRVGSISHLQFELGKILCDVSCFEGLVIAGYTSGDVRLWDTFHRDSRSSCPRSTHQNRDVTPKPHVCHVRVNESVAVAAYEDGSLDVWSTENGLEPIHHQQHLHRVHALALSSTQPTVSTACGSEVRMDSPDDRGYWRTLCLTQLSKPVDHLLMVPGHRPSPLVVASACDSVYLLAPGQDEPRTIHSVYGHPVTCLDVTESQAALGVKRCGWAMNDGGNKIQVYSLETGQLEATVGSSAGDFTCVNLRDGPPHLLACGNKDRRVRVYDLRSGCSAASLYAHHLGVSAVQADDWKIVSGGGEGLVCVWEMRMGAKLWEMHNRHPVRYIWFNTSSLVTANIPDEKTPRGACITDDDLTAHRRCLEPPAFPPDVARPQE
uniref:F-box domain-containing protein n=1 Tax=Denticeps clupeoides TaxID=299321 RepID=A0AAY4BRX4_9TELE